MEKARQSIRDILSAAQCPAVLCSFGKDSMLMLALAREVRTDFAVVWFRNGTCEKFAKRIIREWNLTAFSWQPADSYLLTNGEEHVYISEFSFGEDRLPVLTDLATGTACALKAFRQRTPVILLPFDVLLWGVKDSDDHWLKGNGKFKDGGFMLGRAMVHTPIRHMTDDQVRAALVELKVPYNGASDELPMCTACMTADANEVFCPEIGKVVSRHQWEADKSLLAFRQRFALEESNGQRIRK